jgi:magnesium-transporting ATPase (P-type)
VVSGIGAASRRGILVKGGAALEAAGRLKALAFDKTGTLTEGRPVVSRVVPLDGRNEVEMLALAAALERRFGPDYRVVTDGSPAAALARLGEACDRVTAAVADGAIAVRSVRDFLGAE